MKTRNFRKNALSLSATLLAIVIPAPSLFAQGCIISRSSLESSGADSGSYLTPGSWTMTTGFRHVYSHVHFSGPTQNFGREQAGTEVQSKTNLANLDFTYQLTPRIGVSAAIPFLYASRRQQSQYGTLHTAGLSDITLGVNSWVRSPRSEGAGLNNAQIGVSLLFPSGAAHQNNSLVTTYGGTANTQFPDYSVQPGGGTWGMVMSWQAFQSLGAGTSAFVGGDYVMTQGGYHNYWTSHGGTSNSAPNPTPGMTQFDAIQDQYMIEIGLSRPAPRIRGLQLNLAVRDEGVPARNLIGNDLGFKRPGFGIALTPGFVYSRGGQTLQFSLGKVLIRDRTRSVAEDINGSKTGDAAFANYVWMASYTLRVPGRNHGRDSASAVAPSGTVHAMEAMNSNGAQAGPDDFKAFRLRTLDGKTKTLQDFSNKLTMVTFFFPRCPYCNAELPEIQKIYDRYKDKGLSAVWINVLPEEQNLIAGWQVAKNLTVPVLVGATQAALVRDYHIESTPATYLLDQNGRIVYHVEGYKAGDEKLLESRIDTALTVTSTSPAATASASVPACPPAAPAFVRYTPPPFGSRGF